MVNPFSLEGKRILITGAASGIGKATASLCAQLGADLILVDLNEGGLLATSTEIGKETTVIFPINLTDEKELTSMVSFLPK